MPRVLSGRPENGQPVAPRPPPLNPTNGKTREVGFSFLLRNTVFPNHLSLFTRHLMPSWIATVPRRLGAVAMTILFLATCNLKLATRNCFSLITIPRLPYPIPFPPLPIHHPLSTNHCISLFTYHYSLFTSSPSPSTTLSPQESVKSK